MLDFSNKSGVLGARFRPLVAWHAQKRNDAQTAETQPGYVRLLDGLAESYAAIGAKFDDSNLEYARGWRQIALFCNELAHEAEGNCHVTTLASWNARLDIVTRDLPVAMASEERRASLILISAFDYYRRACEAGVTDKTLAAKWEFVGVSSRQLAAEILREPSVLNNRSWVGRHHLLQVRLPKAIVSGNEVEFEHLKLAVKYLCDAVATHKDVKTAENLVNLAMEYLRVANAQAALPQRGIYQRSQPVLRESCRISGSNSG